MLQRWVIIIALVGLALAALLAPGGCLSGPSTSRPRTQPAPPPAEPPSVDPVHVIDRPIVPPATLPPDPTKTDTALTADLASLFHAFSHLDKPSLNPNDFARLAQSIRDRAWVDLDTYLFLLRELSSTYGANSEFLAFVARVMGPQSGQRHMDIVGRVGDLLPFLGESAPPGIRAIAAQALIAAARDVASSKLVPRLEAPDLDLVLGVLDSSRDEALVESLARAFAVYAKDSRPINDWFLRWFAAAGPTEIGRLRLMDSYLLYAQMSGPVLTMIVHALDVLDGPGRSSILKSLALRGLDPESRSTILPEVERLASSDPDPSCRGNAMAVLLQEDDPTLFARTARLLAQEPDAKARERGVSQLALDEFFGGHPATESARFATAMSFLGDPSPPVGDAALRAGYVRIKRDLTSQDNANALTHGRELLDAIKSLQRDRAIRLKGLAVDRLSRDWPEALDDPQLKAELDSIK